MSYNFSYIVNEKIGKLSWGMTISSEMKEIKTVVGEMVEITEKFFVSGVWDGEFKEGNFEQAEFFCGCGVKLLDNEILVSTSTHERQRICYMKKEGQIYVSNSLPFLLALTDEKLDVNYHRYEAVLCSIIDGLSEYEKDIPLASGNVMRQLFSADMEIDHALNIEIRRKKVHRDFLNYDDYYSSMKKVCEKILSNGKDVARKNKLEMIATTSSGYDSSSCAAVVYNVGCEYACSLKEGKYDEDTGIHIAQQIGYKKIIEAGCYDYRERKDNLDAIFFADGDLGFFMPFDGFRNDFKNKIVVTGISGGYMWDKDSKVNIDSKRSGYYYYLANISFIEHSLQIGYIMMPLVLYASSAAESVVKISNSDEMKPWTLNNSYDRPIPRRILETSGVKRGTFATANRGMGVSISRNFTLKQIKPKMTHEGYDSFVKWINTKGNNRWTIKRIVDVLKYHASTTPEYMDLILKKFNVHTNFSKLHENHVANPGLPAKMIVWAVEEVSSKYKKGISST